ncbi:hypothetical protein [Nocardia sp. BMG51109]|uniref:hypothetical protein n=1 Tax=Nocardia sp. BMG51109 TaxID=1056816 RepID=UPI00046490A7|nr:hypothetical protein [Nocardia sp. BMG51109]
MDVVVDRTDSLTRASAATVAPPRRRKATRPTGPPGESPERSDTGAVATLTRPAAPERTPRTRGRPPRIPRPRIPRVKLGRRGFHLLAVILAVVALATAATVTTLALRQHQRTEAAANHESAVVDTARRGVTALINIRRDSADADFTRLADLTTAPFADELHSQSANYLQAIRDADVLSTGEVVAAGPAADDGNDIPGKGPTDDGTTTVIVAADAQVTNTQNRQQEKRSYRFSVKIKEVDGILKMSEVEFVP